MASDPDYRVHGIWSKLLKQFINEHNPKSIVSFSDNRLFSGKVYEKMGFKFDGEVKPDYYWTINHKRFHKSKMRKPKGCKKTETELRTEQGYSKIWDLGKKRWVLIV
jgi:predicted acetyltransferase